MPGNKFNLKYTETVVKKHIPKLSKPVKEYIRLVIEKKLANDPFTYGKPLQYSYKGYRSLRISDYRVIYYIEGNNVIIIAIKHRKEVYMY
jgi:mRNA interferase RelE/StbE